MVSQVLALQHKIRASIPLAEAMQFSIVELNPRSILVQAPLEPNVNIHGTGFAGSLYSLAILTGWALSTHIMELNQMRGELVVAKAEIKYRSPVTGTIRCFARTSEEDCEVFLRGFKSKSSGKLELAIEVGESGNAILQATYAAISRA